MYQEFVSFISEMSANSAPCRTQPASAVSVGSIVSRPFSRMCTSVSVTQSTCCSIDTIMLDSTLGLPGPVIMKKFGNSVDMRPRYCSGPCSHFLFSVVPLRPVMSTLTIAPVIASKPVA